jgi:hypothetical protein
MWWFVVGWLLGRGRRWRSVEELEWRRRRGHPWAFVLVCAMVIGAVLAGAWLWAVVLLALALWLVVAR